MRNGNQKMLKSVFDVDKNSIRTNDIVSKIREFNRIKEKLEDQKGLTRETKENKEYNQSKTIDASLVPKDDDKHNLDNQEE